MLNVISSAAPTITAGAYSAGDAVGGKLTFTGAARDGFNAGVVEAVTITDKGKQIAALDLVLFSTDFTPTPDNSPFDPSDDDLTNCIGVISILAADYSAFNDSGAANKRGIKLPFQLAAGSTSLFGQLVARGTPTYESTSDLTVKLHISQDFGR